MLVIFPKDLKISAGTSLKENSKNKLPCTQTPFMGNIEQIKRESTTM